jgi:hypothetical protein
MPSKIISKKTSCLEGHSLTKEQDPDPDQYQNLTNPEYWGGVEKYLYWFLDSFL